MCSCDSGTPCVTHRGTRWDDSYHLPQNTADGDDPYQAEPGPVSEYEVRDGS